MNTEEHTDMSKRMKDSARSVINAMHDWDRVSIQRVGHAAACPDGNCEVHRQALVAQSNAATNLHTASRALAEIAAQAAALFAPTEAGTGN